MRQRTARSSHPCPGPGEVHYPSVNVPYRMLACAAHWRQVSKTTQDEVYRTHAEENGSVAHVNALHAAIKQMKPL